MSFLIMEDGKVVATKETQQEALTFAEQRVTNSVRSEHVVEIYQRVGSVESRKTVSINFGEGNEGYA